jgi:calcineurin-like phosphoesterase family protein
MLPMTPRIFFTSDTHFGHKNLLKFCPKTRLGKDIEEHDEILIREWNNAASPNDIIYHHGDFCFGNSAYAEALIKRLNGRIHLIWGNHDSVFLNNAKLRQRFEWTGHYREISLPIPGKRLEKQKICMFHFPIHEWHKIHKGSFHLYGHVHGSVTLPGRALDVGVDTRPSDKLMTLWPWEEVYAELSNRPIQSPPQSHHKTEGPHSFGHGPIDL